MHPKAEDREAKDNQKDIAKENVCVKNFHVITKNRRKKITAIYFFFKFAAEIVLLTKDHSPCLPNLQ